MEKHGKVPLISKIAYGFNTAIYAIIPDCVEYGEWKTGLRNLRQCREFCGLLLRLCYSSID